jgi:hypothetical protein
MCPGAFRTGDEGAYEALTRFSKQFLGCLFLQLVTAICKDLSMPSAMLSLASATVSMGCMLDSVTNVYRGTGAFRAASPASAMAMLRTATH